MTLKGLLGRELDVLLKILEFRVSAEQDIRERSEKFTLWMAGLCFAAAAALLVSGNSIEPRYTLWMIFAAIALGIGIVWNLLSLQAGFERNRKCMVRIETALGLYEPGVYAPEEALYPRSFRSGSTDSVWRRGLRHFHVMFVWALIAIGVLATAIVLRPVATPNGDGDLGNPQAEELHQDSAELSEGG